MWEREGQCGRENERVGKERVRKLKPKGEREKEERGERKREI